MPAYLIYNQLISTIIMGKQDVPHLPLMILTINAHTSIMNQVNAHHLDQLVRVRPTKLVLILRNKVILLSKLLIVGLLLPLIIAFTIILAITQRIVIINRLQLTIHMYILQSIIRHLMLHTINHVPLRHLLL